MMTQPEVRRIGRHWEVRWQDDAKRYGLAVRKRWFSTKSDAEAFLGELSQGRRVVEAIRPR